MEANFVASVAFLKAIYPDGPWMLTAISVNKQSIDARTFDTGEEQELLDWLNLHRQKNLYYSVNPPITEAREKKKLSKTDVARVHYIHVDVDPRDGEDVGEEQKRILGQLQSYKLPPSFIIFSGGGYNALWKLACSIDIGDGSNSPDEIIARAVDVERRNWQLELDFSTPDHCRDISRILRLPGSVNRPDSRKIAKGRTTAVAQLLVESGKIYDYSEFMATPAVSINRPAKSEVSRNVQRVESLESLNVPDRLKVMIAQGFDPESKKAAASRSEILFHVCCELVRCQIPDEIILGIITDSRYMISASVLDKKSSSERYAHRQLSRAKDMAIDPKLAEMNDKHAVIANYGGRCMIMIQVPGGVDFQRKRDFLDSIDHQKIKFELPGGKEKSIGVGTWWFNHIRRRQYNRVVFEPGLEMEGDLNLWRGFAHEAIEGENHKRYLEHMFENVCSGVQEHFDYLLGWMARVVQTPRTQSMVAPVLLGERGTGKSIFAKFFGAIFGRHTYVASDIHELTGRFNSHLAGALFVIAEEAFDLRDKRHESVLKERITGQTIGIEKKGVDIVQIKNYIHLMMTSNNERVVPAGDKERRFFVIRVKEKTHGNDYFLKIVEDQRKTGPANLLHFLLNMDISNYDVTNVPQTKSLREQQEHNISYERDWLLQKLEQGVWVKGQKGPVIKTDLHSDYIRYCKELNISRPLSLRAFGLWLKKELPEIKDKQLTSAQASSTAGDRPWAYIFPPIEKCREQFIKNRGWKDHTWPVIIADTADVIDISSAGDPF